MEKGDCFLMGVINRLNPRKHIWIAISNPQKETGLILIINLSKNKERAGGDCSFLKKEYCNLTEEESWVCFEDAKLINPKSEVFLKLLTEKMAIPLTEKFPNDCVNKIVEIAKKLAAKPHPSFRKDFLPFLD